MNSVKSSLVLSGTVLLLIVAGIGIRNHFQRTSVERVMQEINRANEAAAEEMPEISFFAFAKVKEVLRKYTANLRSIDVKGCPDDFYEAFVLFRRSQEDAMVFVEDTLSSWGLVDIMRQMVNEVLTLEFDFSNMPMDTEERIVTQRSVDAWRSLEDVAAQYGVR